MNAVGTQRAGAESAVAARTQQLRTTFLELSRNWKKLAIQPEGAFAKLTESERIGVEQSGASVGYFDCTRSRVYPGGEKPHDHLLALLDPRREASLKRAVALHVAVLGPHRRDLAHSGHAGDHTVMIGRLDHADVRGRPVHCGLMAAVVVRL